MAAMALAPVLDAIGTAAAASADIAGLGAVAAGGAGLADIGATLALPSIGTAAADLGAAVGPAIEGAGLTAESIGSGLGAAFSGAGAAAETLAGSSLASPAATLGGQSLLSPATSLLTPAPTAPLTSAGSLASASPASAAATAAPPGIAPSAGDVTSVFDPTATQFGPSPTGFSLGTPGAPGGVGVVANPLPGSGAFPSGTIPSGASIVPGSPGSFDPANFVEPAVGGQVAGPGAPSVDLSGAGKSLSDVFGGAANTLGGGGAGPIAETSPGTVGWVDSAYGNLVPPSAPALPSADAFASELAPAPQLSQLTPAGILDPGASLPDYGTMQFQTAFGDFGPTPISPTTEQIAAQVGGVGPTGVSPASQADVMAFGQTPPSATYNPALDALGLSPSDAMTAAASPADQAVIYGPGFESGGPGSSAAFTPSIQPGGTPGADLANAGYPTSSEPIAAASPTGLPAAGTPLGGYNAAYNTQADLIAAGLQPNAETGAGLAYDAAPGSVPATGGPDVASAGGASPAVAPQTPQAPAAGGSAVSSDGFTPTVAGGAAGAGLAPAAGAGSFLSSALKNPATLLAGGGLALDVLRGNQNPPGYNQILSQAEQTGKSGNQMQSYLASGQLPPGLQTSLDSARESAAATIRSSYASRGMSGSSAEAQDLQNLNNRIVSQGADMALQLFQQGLSETQISSQLYQIIMNEAIQQDQSLSQGIASMVTALASMSRPLTAAA